jgi:hypothetical protein
VKMLMIARLSNKLQLSVQCDSIKTWEGIATWV